MNDCGSFEGLTDVLNRSSVRPKLKVANYEVAMFLIDSLDLELN
jgi:hypothetical protein